MPLLKLLGEFALSTESWSMYAMTELTLTFSLHLLLKLLVPLRHVEDASGDAYRGGPRFSYKSNAAQVHVRVQGAVASVPAWYCRTVERSSSWQQHAQDASEAQHVHEH